MSNIRVKEIKQANERTLQVQWTDNRIQKFDVVELRRRCPCAACIDEWTNNPILKSEDVPDSIRPQLIESVGSYAMSIKFNDGHSTGIYTFSMLRNL